MVDWNTYEWGIAPPFGISAESWGAQHTISINADESHSINVLLNEQ